MKKIVTTAILLLIFSILLTGCSTNAQHVVDISNENLVLRNKIDELEKEVIRLNNEIKELTEVKVGLGESIKVLEISERTTMDESLEENKELNINKYYDLLNEPLSISKDSQYYLKQNLDGNYNFKHLDTTLVKVFDFTGQGDGSVSYFSHLSTIPLLTPVNLLICLTESPSLRSFLMQLFLTLISKS